MSLDFKHPDYDSIIEQRKACYRRLSAKPALVKRSRVYYREHIADFITDWGVTIDPRNAERNLPVVVPFILFDKQREWIDFLIKCWRDAVPGITEKSRDMGVTWEAVAFACSLCLFNDDMAIGFGSRKEEYVDKLGDPKSILYKARVFMRYLPWQFRGGWNIAQHAPHMRIEFPETHSIIAGEAGDAIGRGDRKSIYFVDEAAHLERPLSVDAALSATTNCRQDISSVNGMANSFAERRHSGKVRVFTMHWRDDPRKDDAWYSKQCERLDPVVVAQEIDINYSASVEGIIIPQAWVIASVDAHVRLGIKPSGEKRGALDVADQGKDKNCFSARHGILVNHCESWSGKGESGSGIDDLYETAQRAFLISDLLGLEGFHYDADGLGASVRGDAKKINEQRYTRKLSIRPHRGSDSVLNPDRIVPGTERTALDLFENFKAQCWWSLHFRFQATYRALQGAAYEEADLISLDSSMAELNRLKIELSQPVWKLSKAGKMMVDKTPDGVLSPNHADSVCILMAPHRAPMKVNARLLEGAGNHAQLRR